MLDIWRSFAAAFELLVMVPSLVHSIFPSLPLSKRFRDVVRLSPSASGGVPPPKTASFFAGVFTTHERQAHKTMAPVRTMDDFLREVRRLFEAPLDHAGLLAMSAKLENQFRVKLQASDMCMLPSFNHTLPTGFERGSFLALDCGGTTFRVAVVELNGKDSTSGDSMRIVRMRSVPIGDAARALEGHAFFDWLASRIEETLAESEVQKLCAGKVMPMGLAWSFPVEQTSINNYKLLDMGKGFRATAGVLGQDLGDLIMQACRRRNLQVSMKAIVNDSSATLLSKAYCDQSTRLALILGTGTNASIYLPVSALAPGKFGVRPQSWHEEATHVLVNTESSMFGKNILPMTRWDDCLNQQHLRPDFQPFEHFVSGRYLGELVRLVLVEAIQTAGLFGGEMPDHLLEQYALDTATLAIIEGDDTPALDRAIAALHTAHPLPTSTLPSPSDLFFVRAITKLVTHRATAILATGVHALWSLRTSSEGLDPATAAPITIGCNGSVIEKYPCYRASTQKYLDRLTQLSGASDRGVVLELAEESAIFGAAVAVSCAEPQ